MNIKEVPTDLTDFLIWLKQRTEEFWSNYSTATFEDYQAAQLGGRDWLNGTKWLNGFSDDEINSFERVWKITFPPDYREFLRILGAPDRPMFAAWFAEHGMVQGERPSFYDWRSDTRDITNAMNSPLEGILFDVEHNNLWPDSWGVRPDLSDARRLVVTELIQAAPPLIPIIGHRYLLGTPIKTGNPVLSVHQSDIIVYGSDLRNFLINELRSELEIYLDEDAQTDDESVLDYAVSEKVYQESIKSVDWNWIKSIPFWGEFIG